MASRRRVPASRIERKHGANAIPRHPREHEAIRENVQGSNAGGLHSGYVRMRSSKRRAPPTARCSPARRGRRLPSDGRQARGEHGSAKGAARECGEANKDASDREHFRELGSESDEPPRRSERSRSVLLPPCSRSSSFRSGRSQRMNCGVATNALLAGGVFESQSNRGPPVSKITPCSRRRLR